MEPEHLSGVEDQVWEDMNGPSALFWRLYGSGRDYVLLWRLIIIASSKVLCCGD
jgi:hypothetical protein